MASLILLFTVLIRLARPEPVLSARDAAKEPPPLSIPASGSWDGNDGSWSSFALQVGTPSVPVRVLFASDENMIWLVDSGACSVPSSACAVARGGTFDYANSSTFVELDWYNLAYLATAALGYGGGAYYTGNFGLDNLIIGGNIATQNQTVAAFQAEFPWLGIIGLRNYTNNVQVMVGSTVSHATNNTIFSLRQQSIIPSLSWAYTAGAYSMATFGSLTVGGYDASRRGPQEIDVSYDESLTVALWAITINGTGFSTTSLLTNAINVAINTMVSPMWLPLQACQMFQQAFNLTWNDTSQLYLIDDTNHARLSHLNPAVEFTIAANLSTTANIRISIPYLSFNHTIGLPYETTSMRYFPLKRGNDTTGYILGRVFMQHAYIVTDYERSTFSISQALFPPTGASTNLGTIHSTSVPTTALQASHHTSIGPIIGGAVGGLIVIGIIGLLLWRLHKRRSKHADGTKPFGKASEHRSIVTPNQEKGSFVVSPSGITELPSPHSPRPSELPSPQRSELPSPPASSWSNPSGSYFMGNDTWPPSPRPDHNYELDGGSIARQIVYHPRIAELPGNAVEPLPGHRTESLVTRGT